MVPLKYVEQVFMDISNINFALNFKQLYGASIIFIILLMIMNHFHIRILNLKILNFWGHDSFLFISFALDIFQNDF